ncbi:MAG: methylenetetrahydrofolate reductase [Chloroflexi bacterium]|nr:methylenetetrahydrofolate reductase [Chloroflexota bacterium]
MTKVTEHAAQDPARPLVICDFSPPRGADASFLDQARALDVEFICVAYSPGKSVRVDSAALAAAIKEQTGKEVVFNLACRDMNRLALQSHLLGAQVLGLENVLVIQGDAFTAAELASIKPVNDYQPTQLIRAIKSMNEGVDCKGLKLRVPTRFCVGASIDLGRGVEHEARLTHKKVQAGADFFVTQPLYDARLVSEFQAAYASVAGESPARPIFYGVQVLAKEGILFGNVPQGIREEMAKGRSGEEIALELWSRFREQGVNRLYLVPPILKGGARDYEAARRVLEALSKVERRL